MNTKLLSLSDLRAAMQQMESSGLKVSNIRLSLRELAILRNGLTNEEREDLPHLQGPCLPMTLSYMNKEWRLAADPAIPFGTRNIQ